jgi:hypothetical protein
VYGRIMLKLIGKKWNVSLCGLYSSRWDYEPVAASCEHGNEVLGSTVGGEFRDQLRNY